MNSTRYSFKVDMNYYVDGQKLLGMKKINLNNNYKDPSYMRERLSYDMMRSLGIPTPQAFLCESVYQRSLCMVVYTCGAGRQ
jgi:spore coat protein CotH